MRCADKFAKLYTPHACTPAAVVIFFFKRETTIKIMTTYLEQIKDMFHCAKIPYPTHALDRNIFQGSMKAFLSKSFHPAEKGGVVQTVSYHPAE